MLIFITGGAASGKSACAEALAVSSGAEKLFYIATMKPDGSEAQERIDRHRDMRCGKNFTTIECPVNIKDLKIPASYDESLILMEDLGNLVANEQFDVGGSDDDITGRICEGIKNLCGLAGTVIAVGDEVFSDTGVYGEDTLRYMRLLARCGKMTADLADSVTEVVYGIAVQLK